MTHTRTTLFLSLFALATACGTSHDPNDRNEWDINELIEDPEPAPNPEPEPVPEPEPEPVAHASCDTPSPLEPNRVRTETIRRGHPDPFTPCGEEVRGHTFFYEVAMVLGEGWTYQVYVDAPNRPVQVQVLAPNDLDVCAQEELARCEVVEVGEGSASILTGASIGGGRSPAVALIAVTIGRSPLPDPDPTFTVTLTRSR